MKKPATILNVNKRQFAYKNINLKTCFNFILISFLISSCISMQALFDQHAYESAIAIKIKAIQLVEKSKGGTSISTVNDEVESLSTELQILYEYETRRKNNDESVKMIELIKDPNKNLLSGFVKRWESGTSMNEDFIDQVKIQIEEGFNILIELESKKLKPSDDRVTSFISKF